MHSYTRRYCAASDDCFRVQQRFSCRGAGICERECGRLVCHLQCRSGSSFNSPHGFADGSTRQWNKGELLNTTDTPRQGSNSYGNSLERLIRKCRHREFGFTNGDCEFHGLQCCDAHRWLNIGSGLYWIGCNFPNHHESWTERDVHGSIHTYGIRCVLRAGCSGQQFVHRQHHNDRSFRHWSSGSHWAPVQQFFSQRNSVRLMHRHAECCSAVKRAGGLSPEQ